MSNFENHPLNPGEAVPFFIAAGVLKEPNQLRPFMGLEDPLMSPVLTLGAFTLHECAGNAKDGEQDFVYYEGRRMAGNARGLPNPGVLGIKDLWPSIERLTEHGIKTIIQVTNLPSEDPLEVIPDLMDMAKHAKPTAIEINLSCPNGKKPDGSFHAPVCNDPEASEEIVRTARERLMGTDIILGIKDSPHVTSLDDPVDIYAIRRLADATGMWIDFVTGINTIGNQPFPEITCANGRGGMSGPVVAEVAHQHQDAWQGALPEIPYLSTGGIDSQNIDQEVKRLDRGALLIGGAQEFYRHPHDMLAVVERWAQAL